jgi:3-oxoacyl-[acyl-carrier protein] reductase
MITTTALVTGAASGIGKACALALAGPGVRIVLHTRGSTAIEAVASEVRALGAQAAVEYADLEATDAAELLAERTISRYGTPQILVNNVGFREPVTIDNASVEKMRRAMAINLEAPLILTKRVFGSMRTAGGGSIVNIGGVFAHTGAVNRVTVVASKAALEGLTKASALEGAPYNIRVNLVSPGYIDSGDPEVIKAMVPLGRAGTSAEVGGIVAFLCSPAAAYITGQVIHVNGGMYL